MIECVSRVVCSMSLFDVLSTSTALGLIILFSFLACQAEDRMWRAIGRYNGERREMQRQITMGKAHLV